MKSILKTIIHKILSARGYKLQRLSVASHEFVNFSNLAHGYEESLNQQNIHIPSNKLRHSLLAKLLGTSPYEAYYIIRFLHETRGLDGAVCEFGVAQGLTSTLIANEISAYNNKILHLFDSFQGLPSPTAKDVLIDDISNLGSISAYSGKMSYPVSSVKNNLSSISFPNNRYVVHKGFIEQMDKTDSSLPRKVSFAYIDLDFYEPIKTALYYLHSILVQGGAIIVDDYDFFSSGAKSAVDEFLSEQNSTTSTYSYLVPNEFYGHFAVIRRLL